MLQRTELASRSERVAVLEPGRKIRVFEVRSVTAGDLPLEVADRAIPLGRERAKVEGGWVSLESVDGIVLLTKTKAKSTEPEEVSSHSESDDAMGVGFGAKPKKSLGSTRSADDTSRASAPSGLARASASDTFPSGGGFLGATPREGMPPGSASPLRAAESQNSFVLARDGSVC